MKEQNIELNLPLYFDFLNYEKLFNNIDRESFYKKKNEEPKDPTKDLNKGMQFRLLHGKKKGGVGALTDTFEMRTLV